MDLFIYSTVSEENRKQLEDSFKALVPKEKMEVFRSFDDFSQRLKLPAQSKSIAVLAPGSRQELQEILSRIDLLRDLRIIVIAPDHEAETTAVAHQLRPRYLTYLNGDFGDLAAVLDKMLTDHLSNEEPSSSLSER
jgi:glycerol dehydrogenase-like iron-containing ADH family enzyme